MRSRPNLLGIAALSVASACGGRPPERPLAVVPVQFDVLGRPVAPAPVTAKPAELDAELRDLPGATALWLVPEQNGPATYVVEVGPEGGVTAPLVLVHGLGHSGLRDFYPVLRGLSQTRRVIALDLPGLGRSPLGTDAPTIELFTGRVSAVVAARAPNGCDVLGHSLGGVVALSYAAGHPELVRRLVLVDVAGVLHREAFVGEQVQGSLAPVRKHSPGLAQLLGGAGEAAVSALRVLEPSEQAMRWAGEPLTAAGTRAALALILRDVGPDFPAVRADTLLLWGAGDPIAPLRTALLLDDRIEHAHLVALPGVGHVPMAEAPDRFLEHVLAHLNATASSPQPPRADLGVVPDYACKGQHDVLLSGTYERVTVSRCRRVVLRHARVGSLYIEGSDVQLVQTHVVRGVRAVEADLRVTGGEIRGSTALALDGSRADVAGALVVGSRAAVQAEGTSRVLWSATWVQGPSGQGWLHGHMRLGGGQGL